MVLLISYDVFSSQQTPKHSEIFGTFLWIYSLKFWTKMIYDYFYAIPRTLIPKVSVLRSRLKMRLFPYDTNCIVQDPPQNLFVGFVPIFSDRLVENWSSPRPRFPNPLIGIVLYWCNHKAYALRISCSAPNNLFRQVVEVSNLAKIIRTVIGSVLIRVISIFAPLNK